MNKPRGGKRPNSGPKKGAKYAKTRAKEEAREIARQIITSHLEPLIEAQVAHASGLKYLVARHKTTGKFAKLTEEMMQTIASGDNPEYEAIEVWSKDPSVQAFSDLMNRALDKPKEQEIEIKLNILESELIQKLLAGRKRASEKKPA